MQTVRGEVRPERLGTTLIHEHVLVDFVGARDANPGRYNADEVFRVALPKLRELQSRGCRALVECTPAHLGRDPHLLRRLSEACDLQIITNTGLYGANGDKHVPEYALAESPEQLSDRWTAEYRHGIDGSGVRPGFLKIGVDAGPLSGIDLKLVTAACLCHRATGLRMHVHCGDGRAALSILELAKRQQVSPQAFVWVHAQSERDRGVHLRTVEAGAWLEFDGISQSTHQLHLEAVTDLIKAGYLDQLLISQDSGWYRVGEPGGGQYNGYVYLFDAFLPALRSAGVTDAQIRKLVVTNPTRALTFSERAPGSRDGKS
ncbi:MAG TPA: hypothetical protein VES20_09635 [Bryobacteraceae bacterium]|nr:hypothetical protein [Bryobacteraceae bacterium]